MVVAFALAGAAAWSWSHDWFWWFILGEVAVAAVLYLVMRQLLAKVRWPSAE